MNIKLDHPVFTLSVGDLINIFNNLLAHRQEDKPKGSYPILKKEKNEILIKEASELTGLAVSTIRTKCHLNQIPYFKPKGSKLLRFRKDELIQWMASTKFETLEEEEKKLNAKLSTKKQ